MSKISHLNQTSDFSVKHSTVGHQNATTKATSGVARTHYSIRLHRNVGACITVILII
jgi:hypothetical protein